MKYTYLIGIFLLYTGVLPSHAQKSAKGSGNLSVIDEMANDAKYLCEYDAIAWQMSDLAATALTPDAKMLGREWFCYQDIHQKWHGVYGKFLDTTYKVVFHYVQGEQDNIDLDCNEPDSAMLFSYSKSIQKAYQMAAKLLGKSYTRFNKFLRRNADGSISIWILPAVQPGNLAVYGAEFYYQFDRNGDKLLDSNEYYRGSCKGFKLGKSRDVNLDYSDLPGVTFGSIFFAWRHREDFSTIYINTSTGSTALKFDQQKGYHWVTGPKQPPETASANF
ncbi:hypothetical protein COR50_11190 [Chitinophaga caeni]|uniref:EF-hand domain-containing protein n=1 Tax=Chitinophaga caeni TaxID=2029983 RepID=A0A291QUR9_9BACT|nr:hypothetical protein [Chitinophaga caeni]ATL47686.1 hypothetical protein COR50_11190 [Chitinophaga caeni]